MINLLYAGLFKLRKSMFIKIVFLVAVGSAGVMSFAAYGMAQGSISVSSTGMTAFFSDIQMTALLGSLTAGIFICGDFEDKSIADAISGGIGRGAVIAAKFLLFFITVALIMLPFFVAAFVSLGIGAEFTAYVPTPVLMLMASAQSTAVTADMLLKAAAILLVNLLVYAGQLSLCILLVFLFQKPVLVVAVSYAVSFLSGQLSSIGGKAGDLLAFTPFGAEFTKLTLDAGAEVFIKPVVCSIGFIAVVAVITYRIFKKAEIK